jgi:hypothetical protein
MKTQLPVRTRTILVNSSIAVGLAFEYWKGRPTIAIVIAGILLFAVANVVIVMSTRKRNATNN